MKYIVAIGFAFAGIFGLSRCGTCVLGQGDCDQALNSTTLFLKGSTTSVSTGVGSNSVTFTPVGGTVPYRYTIIIGTGTQGTSSDTGMTATVTAGSGGYFCARVTDANGNTGDRCVTVSG